ncbi:unnamed protein product [Trypanosoma congolense IL3000]|uniref:Uncharacterized protein n=1 Tax=Trypanosoma congolense (strain IL3000) TaxID=1068625 RepID=F9WHU5_TRYCI|nr:conserved hypothetical protein [Trypanosoma congolense IL3000]CCD16890.1 unnamed protein product [Trypanosoma congolense IL3000]
MAEVVPDDYFPLEGESNTDLQSAGHSFSSAAAGGTMAPQGNKTSATWHFCMPSQAAPVDYLPEFRFTVESSDEIRAAVTAANAFMQAGDLHAAVDAAEKGGLTLAMVAINGTQLSAAVNMVLNGAVRPILNGFLHVFHTSAVACVRNSSLQDPKRVNESFGSDIGNSTTSGSGAFDLLESATGFIWDALVGTIIGRHGYAEVLMFLACIVLSFLTFSVRLWSKKYCDSVDALASQAPVCPTGGVDGAGSLPKTNTCDARQSDTRGWSGALRFGAAPPGEEWSSPDTPSTTEGEVSRTSLSYTM